MVCQQIPLGAVLGLATLGLAGTYAQAPASPKPGALPAGAIRQLGEVRFPNVGHVIGLAFSPDGKQLVAGSWDASVTVWDVATGKEIRQLTGHEGTVRAFVYSPDSKLLITQGRDRTIRVWDAATGKPLRQLTMPAPMGRSVLSPNGKLLWADTGKEIVAWDVMTGKELCRLAAEERPGRMTVGFTPDSKEVVIAAVWEGTGTIVFRDALTGKKLRELESPAAREVRYGLSYALGDRKLLLGGWSGLYLHDLETGRARKVADSKAIGGGLLAFSPNAKMFAATDSSGVIHVWETATLQARCRFQGAEPGTIPLAFSLDGTTLASGSTDISVLLWDLAGTKTGRVPTGELLTKDLEAAWADLANSDAANAYLAMGRLLSQPRASVAFLKAQIKPAGPAVEKALLEKLFQELASEQFTIREKASAELGKLGDLAEPALRKALESTSTLEVRQRVEKLLRRIEDFDGNLSPERLRLLRAVEIVETIQSTEAADLLKTWAGGAAGALLTRQAQLALRKPGDVGGR
jgi:hypothetical protein